jgi:alkylation response protein AidB-like acyl-CoA dehydrogenase
MATIERAVGGVSFALTDEQKELRALAREFATKEIRPKSADYDERSHHPDDLIGKAHSVGLMNLHVPEEYGGLALSSFDGMLVGEELNWGCSGIGTSIGANGLGSGPVILAGSEEQKATWLPPLLEAPILCSFGLSEPGAGSDVARLQTTAVRRGDEYVLNGSKTFITNASYANCALVLALTDREKGTRGGISGFLVERGTPGFRPGKKENKLGLRASDTAELIFEDCAIPAENLVGVEGGGFKDAMRVLDGGRISIAALSLGIARGALDAALKYATQRRQFGKAISEFQAIQFKLATMATELDAAWLLTMRAAQMKDKGLNVTLESSMAKLYASEVACRICDEGVQIHGGYGFIKDYPAEKFYRDVKLCTIGEGTSEIQRMVISRELLKRM